MAVTIIVHIDDREPEWEMDARVRSLEEFIAGKAAETFEELGLDSYLVDGLSNARVLHRARMYPQQQDNVDVVESVRARALSCGVCARYYPLLILATCLGTWEEYDSLRKLMDRHYRKDCWSTTFLDDGGTETWH